MFRVTLQDCQGNFMKPGLLENWAMPSAKKSPWFIQLTITSALLILIKCSIIFPLYGSGQMLIHLPILMQLSLTHVLQEQGHIPVQLFLIFIPPKYCNRAHGIFWVLRQQCPPV